MTSKEPKFGVELSTAKPVKIIDGNHYLYLIAYVDEHRQEIHPNAIAWIAHKNIEMGNGTTQ